jgi:7-cyano-7-deazaguanine tRNA-ribosyltransferase
MKFEIIDIDALGRIGKLKVNDKEILTPNLFPVVHPYKNIISPEELENLGVSNIFTNAYIMYQNKKVKEDVLSIGIHKF